MKKINKNNCLATEYFEWQPETKTKYYSSHKYYKDVLVSLINCQKGLCAYTEYRLIDESDVNKLSKSFNTSGKYNGSRPEVPIDNEHFDSSLKSENGWSWDNFFGVFSPINRDVKRVREAALIKKKGGIYSVLKPDNDNYDPKKYLKYDLREHMFFPNPELDSNTFEKVKEMIFVLGLNWGFIKMKRKEYILERLTKKDFLEEPSIDQFFTAFELINS